MGTLTLPKNPSRSEMATVPEAQELPTSVSRPEPDLKLFSNANESVDSAPEQEAGQVGGIPAEAFDGARNTLNSAEWSADTDDLQGIAERISGRDKALFREANWCWLENGLDLIRAKQIVGHGNFEAWCKEVLNYSKSKAEKLMRAAEMFGPLRESGTLTDLPPPTLAYAVSAPSVPQTIREDYLRRFSAQDRWAKKEFQRAIQQHRAEVQTSSSEPRDVNVGIALADTAGLSPTHQARLNVDADQGQDRNPAAQLKALALIKACVGQRLKELLVLVEEAGSEKVFTDAALLELTRLASSNAPEASASEMGQPETA